MHSPTSPSGERTDGRHYANDEGVAREHRYVDAKFATHEQGIGGQRHGSGGTDKPADTDLATSSEDEHKQPQENERSNLAIGTDNRAHDGWESQNCFGPNSEEYRPSQSDQPRSAVPTLCRRAALACHEKRVP